MESDVVTVANPEWFTPFLVSAVLCLTAFFVWTMQCLIGHRPMVFTILILGILTGISKLIHPMAHHVLASVLLVAMLGFNIYFTWKSWPRARIAALINAVIIPATAITGYLLFIG